jgi:hypothetical protein
VDLRQQWFTQGTIALGEQSEIKRDAFHCQYRDYHYCDIIYQEKKFVQGGYDRVKELAETISKQLDLPIYYSTLQKGLPSSREGCTRDQFSC